MRKTYKIDKLNENPKEIVISRAGKRVVFTLAEVEHHIDRLLKVREECDATLKLNYAKLKNIEEHHPYIFDLTEEQRYAVHMYHELKTQLKPYEDKLEEVSKQLDEYNEDIADIKSQLPELANA